MDTRWDYHFLPNVKAHAAPRRPVMNRIGCMTLLWTMTMIFMALTSRTSSAEFCPDSLDPDKVAAPLPSQDDGDDEDKVVKEDAQWNVVVKVFPPDSRKLGKD